MLLRSLRRIIPETRVHRSFRHPAAALGERRPAHQLLHPIRSGKTIRQGTGPATVVTETTEAAMVVTAVADPMADHMEATVGEVFSAGFSTDRVIVPLLI